MQENLHTDLSAGCTLGGSLSCLKKPAFRFSAFQGHEPRHLEPRLFPLPEILDPPLQTENCPCDLDLLDSRVIAALQC